VSDPTDALAAQLAQGSTPETAAPPPLPLRFTTGVVQTVNSDGSLSVAIDGNSTGVPASTGASVQVAAGDNVSVLVAGSQIYVIDAVANAQNLGGSLPVGTLMPFSGTTAPPGTVLAQGQAISRTTYSRLNALYAAAGYPYGSGNGTTTFNVPDMRENVPIGADGSTYVLGHTYGVATTTLSSSQLPVHAHTATAVSVVTDPTHDHTFLADPLVSGGSVSGAAGIFDYETGPGATQGAVTGISVATAVTVANAGASAAVPLIQPSLALNYLVKT
jgi:microcystin-dependent protein